MRSFFKKIHLWLSIPTGLIISILCITGALLSFETEILELIYPERYFVENVEGQKKDLDKLISIVNSQLEDNSVAAIKVYPEPNRTYVATLSEGFRVSAFINPYTGAITGIYKFREGGFYKIMALHRWFLDGTRTWGKYTAGIGTLLFVFILISGMVWWVPSDKKKWKSRFQIKTNKGIKRFIHDVHVVLGIYFSILLLVCSLTGLMWSFEWYRNSVASLFGVEVNKTTKKTETKKKSINNIYLWQKVFNNIVTNIEEYQYISINPNGVVVLPDNAPHIRATNKYTYDGTTGAIITKKTYSEQNDMSKIMTWAYALHVGAFGGIFMRVLTCLACWVGGALPLTGYYIFYRKRRKRENIKD